MDFTDEELEAELVRRKRQLGEKRKLDEVNVAAEKRARLLLELVRAQQLRRVRRVRRVCRVPRVPRARHHYPSFNNCRSPCLLTMLSALNRSPKIACLLTGFQKATLSWISKQQTGSVRITLNSTTRAGSPICTGGGNRSLDRRMRLAL